MEKEKAAVSSFRVSLCEASITGCHLQDVFRVAAELCFSLKTQKVMFRTSLIEAYFEIFNNNFGQFDIDNIVVANVSKCNCHDVRSASWMQHWLSSIMTLHGIERLIITSDTD